MGEALHCTICGKPATVHLTQIIKNQIKKVDLCEDCAQSNGVTDPEGFSLAELLTKTFPGAETEGGTGDESATGLVCEQCGYTPKDLKKSGRLGCAACYEFLRPIVLPLLLNLHKSQQHRGKVPFRLVHRVELKREIDNLEQKLQKAISGEDFEEAARCRDRLGALRAQLATPAVST